MNKMVFSFFQSFSNTILEPFKNRETTFINESDLLIANKPYLSKSTLIWDIENISYKRFHQFSKLFPFTPEDGIVVSKRELGRNERRFIEKLQFKYYNSHTIADDKIIKILNIKKFNNKEFIVVSSDSDFFSIIRKLLDMDKKVCVITTHNENKRLLMKLPLTHPNLKIFADEKKKTKR